MPTTFDTDFDDGDLIKLEYAKQFADPLKNLESGLARFREDSGTADAYEVDFSDPEDNGIEALTPGLVIHFKPAQANTGPATLTVEGVSGTLGPVALRKAGAFVLAAGDILAGQIVSVIYNDEGDGRFELLGSFQNGHAGSGTSGTLALYSGTHELDDSSLTDDGTTVTVGSAGSRALSCPGGTNSESFGAGAVAAGERNLSLGAQAGSSNTTGADNVFAGYQAGATSTTGGRNVVIGRSADVDAADTDKATVLGYSASAASSGTALGRDAQATGAGAIALGRDAVASGASSIAIGHNASATADNAIALGTSCIADQADSLCIGGNTPNEIYLGQGRVSTEVGGTDTFGLHATGGSGTDISGADLRLAAGRPTGSGSGRNLVLATAAGSGSGTTLQSLTDRLILDQNGVILLKNAGTVPSNNPAGGHYLYAQSGALKGRGSSGTVTTIAAAEPHCQRCGRDFAVEWHNERYGSLSVCAWCLTDALERVGAQVTIIKEPA